MGAGGMCVGVYYLQSVLKISQMLTLGSSRSPGHRFQHCQEAALTELKLFGTARLVFAIRSREPVRRACDGVRVMMLVRLCERSAG